MSENAKLSEEQLLECFKSLNVPVRMNELKTPTKDFVVRVFDIFLKDLAINISSPLLRPFESIRHLENPDLYENARMLIVLTTVVNNLLQKVSPITITLNDIVAPKPKRTKKIMNYLVILWNNYLKKSDLLKKVEENLQPEIQSIEDIKRDIEVLKDKYQECMIVLQSKNVSSEEVRNLMASKEEQHKKLDKKREEIIEQYNQLKEKETILMTEMADIDIMIVTIKEKLNELDQLIISSPEKIRANIQKLKDKVADIENQIQEKELDKKERKKNYQFIKRAQEGLVKCCTKQHKMLTELQLLQENAQNLLSLNNKCLEENKTGKELQSSMQIKEEMAGAYDQKAAKIQLSKKKQIEEITEIHQMLQKQLEEEKKSLECMNASISHVKERIDEKVKAAVEVFEKIKKTIDETTEKKKLYYSMKQKIQIDFFNGCDNVVKKTKKVFCTD